MDRSTKAGRMAIAVCLGGLTFVFAAPGNDFAEWARKDKEEMNRQQRNIQKPAAQDATQAVVGAVSQPQKSAAVERAPFTVNPQRMDPYKNFKFRVKWDGRYIYGITKVTPLARNTEVLENNAGGDPSSPRRSPGRTTYAALVLERGVTHDTEFESWANLVWQFGAGLGSEASLRNFRKDIIVELYNEAGQLVKAYKVYRCWPSKYQALPTLDANGSEIAIESLTLENEGWERDMEVAEPAERAKATAPAQP